MIRLNDDCRHEDRSFAQRDVVHKKLVFCAAVDYNAGLAYVVL